MAPFYKVLLLTSSIAGLTSAAAVDSFTLSSFREEAAAGSLRRKRQSGILPSALETSLYWFSNFTVGDSTDLRLLIDTGSTDCLIVPGKYKPSKNEKPYSGKKNFTIGYEGVNRAGFGEEIINGTTHEDTVSNGGLTVNNQALGSMTTFKYYDVKQLPYPIQGDGIIGFAGPDSSSFDPPARSWFWNLCHNKQITQCRIGLLFGTSGKGLTVVGKLAKKYLQGDLTLVNDPNNQYTVKGDIAVDNEIVFKNQTIIMDVGTDNIQGPIKQTKQILDSWGYQTHEKTGPNAFDPSSHITQLTAFFKCNEPPAFGVSFPAEADLKPGQKAKLFNVSPKVWDVYNHGNNNCTSILGGTSFLNPVKNPGESFTGGWLLGQPFFSGHYVDFDLDTKTIGYGDLADPSMDSCA